MRVRATASGAEAVRLFAERPARRARARHRPARRRRPRRLPGPARAWRGGAGAVPDRARRADRPPQRLPRRRRRLPDASRSRSRSCWSASMRSCAAAPPRRTRSAAGLVLDPAAHAVVHDGERGRADADRVPAAGRARRAARRGRPPRARSSPPAGPTARSCTTTRSTPTSPASAASSATPARRRPSRRHAASATCSDELPPPPARRLAGDAGGRPRRAARGRERRCSPSGVRSRGVERAARQRRGAGRGAVGQAGPA